MDTNDCADCVELETSHQDGPLSEDQFKLNKRAEKWIEKREGIKKCNTATLDRSCVGVNSKVCLTVKDPFFVQEA